MAANLGDDADTTAAQAGQIAGAFYGESAIPPAWLAKLTMMTEIREMADRLADRDIYSDTVDAPNSVASASS
jgi:ADP-ribosyl-[dinitrogen reductase] hydrolase